MTTTAQDFIRQAMLNPETDGPSIRPSVIMGKFIDHDQVAEYTDCYVNEAHRTRLTGLLASGWIIFRMQTEFGPAGHYVMAYLAKMKPN
jgi:hypothetical protein